MSNVDFSLSQIAHLEPFVPPPHSLEAEQAVLGAMLVDPSMITKVHPALKPQYFYKAAHRHIFSACIQLFNDHCGQRSSVGVDIITVSETLKDSGQLDNVGGRTYINDLALRVLTTENVDYYVELIRNDATLRALQLQSAEMLAATREMAANEAIAYSQNQLRVLQDEFDPAALSEPENPFTAGLEAIKTKRSSGGITGLTSGFAKLDDRLGGLKHSNLIILAARPGMGKSMLAGNIATHVALVLQKPVVFFSLEMSADELAERMIKSVAESEAFSERLEDATARLTLAPLHINERGNQTIGDLRSYLFRKQAEQGALGLVIVDYLQLLQDAPAKARKTAENRTQEITRISNGLKSLAKEFRVPVLALSQLSRNVESRLDKRPMPSDLRDSGSIEQDADSIIFIYRDEVYNSGTDHPAQAEIIIAKNRHGLTGSFNLGFRGGIQKFINFEGSK